MSKPKGYSPETPLAVVPRNDWRRRPELFLGPDHGAWWFLLLEHFLAEVGDPGRRWTWASLRIQGRTVEWIDLAEQPLERPDLFWRDACVELVQGRGGGRCTTLFTFDPLIPIPILSRLEGVLRLALRCVARSRGRSVDVLVDDGPRVTVSGGWSKYAALGAYALSHRTVNAGLFVAEVSHTDAPDASVEILERGVVVGRWPGLEVVAGALGPGMRVVLHSEVNQPPLQREALAVKALEAAIATGS